MSRKKKQPKSARAARRAAARGAARSAALRERLFSTEPGSSATQPIAVASASVIEPHTRSIACPRCAGCLGIEEHRAQAVDSRRLREVRVVCHQCGTRRSLWYELLQPN